MIDEHLQRCFQTQCARLTIDQGDCIDAERLLQGSVLVQRSQHSFGMKTVLNLDHQAHSVSPVGQILPARNALDLAGADGFLQLFRDPFGTDLVRQFGNDNAALASRDLLDGGSGTSGENPSPGFVGFTDSVQAHNNSTAGKVRAGAVLHEFRGVDLGVIQQVNGGVDGFAHVVGWNVGGHAYRNPVRAVDQQVRESGGEYRGLGQLIVIVRHKVDDVLVQVVYQSQGGGS